MASNCGSTIGIIGLLWRMDEICRKFWTPKILSCEIYHRERKEFEINVNHYRNILRWTIISADYFSINLSILKFLVEELSVRSIFRKRGNVVVIKKKKERKKMCFESNKNCLLAEILVYKIYFHTADRTRYVHLPIYVHLPTIECKYKTALTNRVIEPSYLRFQSKVNSN